MDDWNRDGKIDRKNAHFFSENILEGGNSWKSGGSGGGGLTTIAILCMIVGIAEQALIYMAFDIEVKNVPVIAMVILWFVFSIITFAVVIFLMDKFE